MDDKEVDLKLMLKKFAWKVGVFLDIIHLPLAGMWILSVIVGMFVGLQEEVFLVGVVINASQVAVMGCPLMVISNWLRRQYKPEYDVPGGFTFKLYKKYGRKVVVPILFFWGLIIFGVTNIL